MRRPFTEILGVSRATTGEFPTVSLDFPMGPNCVLGFQVPVAGWALDRNGPARWIDVHCDGVGSTRFALNRLRPDLPLGYPAVPRAENGGFEIAVSSLGLPRPFELGITAVFSDECSITVGSIRGTRAALEPVSQPDDVQPVCVTTLGRTGSTWLVHLLGGHPSIATYRPFEFEPRVLSYWLEAARYLSEPLTVYQSLDSEIDGRDWWKASRSRRMAPVGLVDATTRSLLAERSIIETLRLVHRQVQLFYTTAAAPGPTRPRYFAEKTIPGPMTELVSELYPDSREIVLVRDPRDMLASILAFNRQRGFPAFGRDRVSSDEALAYELVESFRGLCRHWRRNRNRAMLLRYEDLILDPRAAIERALTHLGLDTRDSQTDLLLETANRTRTQAHLNHQTAVSPESSIGRWQRELPPDLRAACNDAYDDVLLELGYPVLAPV